MIKHAFFEMTLLKQGKSIGLKNKIASWYYQDVFYHCTIELIYHSSKYGDFLIQNKHKERFVRDQLVVAFNYHSGKSGGVTMEAEEYYEYMGFIHG